MPSDTRTLTEVWFLEKIEIGIQPKAKAVGILNEMTVSVIRILYLLQVIKVQNTYSIMNTSTAIVVGFWN